MLQDTDKQKLIFCEFLWKLEKYSSGDKVFLKILRKGNLWSAIGSVAKICKLSLHPQYTGQQNSQLPAVVDILKYTCLSVYGPLSLVSFHFSIAERFFLFYWLSNNSQTEPVFVNVYGAQESILVNRFRQPI